MFARVVVSRHYSISTPTCLSKILGLHTAMKNPAPQLAPPKVDALHHRHRLTDEDHALLMSLRRHRHEVEDKIPPRTSGQIVADNVAVVVGSWRFIIIQSFLLVAWMTVNVMGWIQAWDPYPFILLNLVLSFQAAYTAPIIMMSQNRQSDLDRRMAAKDARINAKAELEIELLHEKLDRMREEEIRHLTSIIEKLEARIA
jgi:uncharacterized membrane protein